MKNINLDEYIELTNSCKNQIEAKKERKKVSNRKHRNGKYFNSQNYIYNFRFYE
jgi:hypothetical protein